MALSCHFLLSENGEVLLRGVGTPQQSLILSDKCPSVQWQQDGLTIHTNKWFPGAGFLGAPPVSLAVSRHPRSTRFLPNTGCDDEGNNCDVQSMPPCPPQGRVQCWPQLRCVQCVTMCHRLWYATTQNSKTQCFVSIFLRCLRFERNPARIISQPRSVPPNRKIR